MSKRKSDKGRLPPFVPLLVSTMAAPAWVAMSHGAKALYISLKRRVPNGRNVAYLSFRDALAEVKSSKRKIADWFRELEHYGFIALHQNGSLGVDGKGKAPHWRLTELGNTSKASADGLFDPPTRDFLKWDGVMFEPRQPSRKWKEGEERLKKHALKKQNPGSGVGTRVVPASDTPPVPASDTPNRQSGSGGVDIGAVQGGSGVGSITRLTTKGVLRGERPLPTLPSSLSAIAQPCFGKSESPPWE